MMPNGQGRHYLAVKKLSALLRGITSKNNADLFLFKLSSFLCNNVSELQSYKKLCENKGFCNILVPSEDNKILEFNQYKKSDKAPFITDVDLACLIENINEYKNNIESSSTAKVREIIPSIFSVFTISSLERMQNKHDVYRGKYCMKKFSESLREHAMKINSFKKKKIKLLTNEQYKSYKNLKICCICKKKIEDKHAKDKKYCKDRGHCHYTGQYRCAAHSICKYSVPKEIPIVFRYVSMINILS